MTVKASHYRLLLFKRKKKTREREKNRLTAAANGTQYPARIVLLNC